MGKLKKKLLMLKIQLKNLMIWIGLEISHLIKKLNHGMVILVTTPPIKHHQHTVKFIFTQMVKVLLEKLKWVASNLNIELEIIRVSGLVPMVKLVFMELL